MEKLLEKGAKVDLQKENFLTALMSASANGHMEVVGKLLEKGAKVDLQNKIGRTALMLVKRGSVQMRWPLMRRVGWRTERVGGAAVCAVSTMSTLMQANPRSRWKRKLSREHGHAERQGARGMGSEQVARFMVVLSRIGRRRTDRRSQTGKGRRAACPST